MSIVEREMQKKFDEGVKEGVNSVKQRIFKRVVNAIKENMSQDVIDAYIESGDFSQEEIEAAYREATK